MKRVTVVFAIATCGTFVSVACGGSKDSGALFSTGSEDDSGSSGGDARSDAAASTGDDSGGPPGDLDGSTTLDSPANVSDAPIGSFDATPCTNADPSKGTLTFTVENTTITLGNTTWSQNGQNGADNMQAEWGGQCDGQTDITVYNHAGTFDVTQRMQGLVEGPVITFEHPSGTLYVAGYDIANQCAPCGSGTITVSTWTLGSVNGTFDVMAKKVGIGGGGGGGTTRHFTGVWSFHH
jgi:hypothetical protein